MSTQYSVEPQPTAKVLLKTTSGDIELSLWGQQCPLATRNFIQHCMNGYYTGTIFHRLVPGFIIQGGDPTGLGTGGQSALSRDGAPFADEFHNRLRFNRRGLLGMANSGTKDDNASQFFLTLGATPELQSKNTMFGRVEGDTIFNLMRMGESELAEEDGDRPLYPPRVTGAEVLVNPFDDMVAQPKASTSGNNAAKDKAAAKKKRKAGKGAISFGDEEDAEPVVKRAKVNPSFGGAAEANQAQEEKAVKLPIAAAAPPRRRRSTSSQSERSDDDTATAVQGKASNTTAASNGRTSKSPSPEPEQVTKTMSALERTNEQIAALKQAMKRNGAAAPQVPEKKKTALESMIPSTSTRGRKRGKAGADADAGLAMFNAFKRKLGTTADSAATASRSEGPAAGTASESRGGGDDDDEEEARTCDLHFIVNCQSCSKWDEDGDGRMGDDDADDPDWMSHQLTFAKDLLGKDLEWKKKMEELEVIDPREKTRELKDERQKGRDRGGHSWKGEKYEKGRGREGPKR